VHNSQLVEMLENEARYQQQVTAIFRIRCLEGGKDQLMDWFDRVGQVSVPYGSWKGGGW